MGFLDQAKNPDPELRNEHIATAVCVEKLLQQLLAPQSEDWYLDIKMWIGITIVLLVVFDSFTGCFKLGPNGRALFKCAEILGVNLIFLHSTQYYEEHWLLFCVAFSIAWLLLWTFKGMVNKKPRVSFTPDNVYLDFGDTPTAKAVLICIGQCLLAKFLANSAIETEQSMEPSYLYWLTAFMGVQVTAIFGRGTDSQVGSPFRGSLWSFLISNASQLCLQKDGEADSFRPGAAKVYLRGLMSFVTNGIVRDSVAYITPILLMGSSSDLEFVQNALAVLFIPTLDDKTGAPDLAITLRSADSPSREYSSALTQGSAPPIERGYSSLLENAVDDK